MNNALIIDTTTQSLKLILIIDDKAIISKNLDKKRHTAEILPCLNELLCNNKLKLNQIETIGVVSGPGSFTGIRIGATIANAFSLALGMKLVEISALEYLLYGIKEGIALLDSGHDYYALKKTADNDLEYLIIDKNKVDEINLTKIFANGDNDDILIATFKEKCEKGEYCDIIKPFYLKKSSAEKL